MRLISAFRDSPYHMTPSGLRRFRGHLIVLLSHMEASWSRLGTRVEHQTLSEWVFGIRYPATFNTAQALYPHHPSTLSRALQKRHVTVDAQTCDWIAATQSIYSASRFPVQPSNVISIIQDLVSIYQSQLDRVVRLPWPEGSASLAASLQEAKLNHAELASIISDVLGDWVGAGHLTPPTPHWVTPACVKTVLDTGGIQCLLASPADACDIVAPSPSQLFRALAGHRAGAVYWRRPSTLDNESEYQLCETLEDLVDVAMMPSGERSSVMVLPAGGGWLVLVGLPGQQWLVHYLSGGLVDGDQRYKVSAAGDQDIYLGHELLGCIPETAPSGTLYDQIMDLTDQVLFRDDP